MPMISAIAPNPSLDRVSVAPGAASGGAVRAISCLDVPGGKAVHSALTAAALGGNVEAILPLGGHRGTQVQRLLDQEPVLVQVLPIAAETRGTYTVIDSVAGDVIEVIEPSPRLTAEEAAAFETTALDSALRARFVLASGSLPDGLDDGFYARVVDVAHRGGGFSVIDARGEALRAALAAGPDLVKPNLDEARELAPHHEPHRAPEDLAHWLRRLGARRVWLSLGEAGSILVDDDGTTHRIDPLPGQVLSAVGCGDALLGGLAAGITKGLPLLDAVRLGAAAASDKLGRAHPAFVNAARVMSLMRQVQVVPAPVAA